MRAGRGKPNAIAIVWFLQEEALVNRKKLFRARSMRACSRL
jgi:hypothetical protein